LGLRRRGTLHARSRRGRRDAALRYGLRSGQFRCRRRRPTVEAPQLLLERRHAPTEFIDAGRMLAHPEKYQDYQDYRKASQGGKNQQICIHDLGLRIGFKFTASLHLSIICKYILTL
jgi:hypothetical protein